MMKKSYILIILISFLVISPKLHAQVECPCDFESIPESTECWGRAQFEGNDPSYLQIPEPGMGTSCQLLNNDTSQHLILFIITDAQHPSNGQIRECRRIISNLSDCDHPDITQTDLTPEELKACQCELLAYVTALNEVAGISVSTDPPYECGNVDCRPLVLTPIPTLSEWGMIITAGVLGLLAVIGLFVMRRRKVTA